MTGPDHYKYGEMYLRIAEDLMKMQGSSNVPDVLEKADSASFIAAAHFAAAQVAATVDLANDTSPHSTGTGLQSDRWGDI